jgi:hypothetical protein
MAENVGGKCALAGTDFDQIPATGFSKGADDPCGDGSGWSIRKHRRSGEIAASPDPGDPPGIVAMLGIVQRLGHELLEGDGGVNVEHRTLNIEH